jgi:hypothetical protein
VTYIRTPKSIFSDSIRDSIDNINNHFSRVAYDNGYRTEKWYVEQVNFTKSELESEKQKQAYDCITEIQNKSVDLSPDYLQKLCRNFNITDVNTGDRISLDRLI